MQEFAAAGMDTVQDEVHYSALTRVPSRPEVTVFDFLSGHVTWEELEMYRVEV